MPRVRRSSASRCARRSAGCWREDVVSRIDVPAAGQLGDGRLCLARQRARDAGADSVFASPAPASPGGRFERHRRAAQCVRIMTGAVMPDGLDTVVPQEFVPPRRRPRRHPARASSGRATTALRRRGPGPGEVALPPAALLRPADLGLLASLGCAEVAGVPAPARRLLLDRRRAALGRRAADARLRLRQQPLHALGDAAAPRRRGHRPRRRARRSRGASRRRFAPRPATPTR